MEQGYVQVARAVADDLASTLGEGLRADLEIAIADTSHRHTKFDPSTTIALAAFILSVAQFGYSVIRDLREDRRKTSEGQIDSKLVLLQRMEIHYSSDVSTDRSRKQILEKTVEMLTLEED